MKYNEQTIYDDFRHYYNFNGKQDTDFIDLLNKYYDKIKTMSINDIKALLPSPENTGPSGTYFKEWMIKECNPTKEYNFTINASIFDWYGDRTTTDVVTVAGNNLDEIYQRLLIGYLDYLIYLKHMVEGYGYNTNDIENTFNHITEVITNYDK